MNEETEKRKDKRQKQDKTATKASKIPQVYL